MMAGRFILCNISSSHDQFILNVNAHCTEAASYVKPTIPGILQIPLLINTLVILPHHDITVIFE